MGYDLTNIKTGDYFRFRIYDFPIVLQLAGFYGWIPKGTLKPSYWNESDIERPWDGGYLTNSGQIVTDEDAVELSDCLETAMNDIPTIDLSLPRNDIIEVVGETLEHRMRDLLATIEMVKSMTPDDKSILLAYFSDPHSRQNLKSFISFSRKGTFIID